MLRSQVLMIIDIAYLDMALAKSSEFLDFFRIAFPSASAPNVSLREQCIVLRMKRHSWGTSSSTWKHKYYMLFFSIITFPGSPCYCFENSLGFVKYQDHPATSCWERLQSALNCEDNSTEEIRGQVLVWLIAWIILNEQLSFWEFWVLGLYENLSHYIDQCV